MFTILLYCACGAAIVAIGDGLLRIYRVQVNGKSQIGEPPREVQVLRRGDVQILKRGQEITGIHLARGIHLLVEHAESFRPDCIVGLNSGGILCGAYLASILGIPDQKLYRKFVDPATGETRCNGKGLGGRILIVDDITRTGNTLRLADSAVRKEIASQAGSAIPNNEGTSENIVKLCTLVAASNERGEPLGGLDMFSAIFTPNANITLPWSSQKNATIEQRFSNFEKTELRNSEQNLMFFLKSLTSLTPSV